MPELDGSIRYVKGFGEVRAKAMGDMGLLTLRDLLDFFPRDYEDRTKIRKISELLEGDAVCVRAVVSSDVVTAKLKKTGRGLSNISSTRVFDDTGVLALSFFNQRYVGSALSKGGEYVFFGRITRGKYGLQMINPVFEKAGKDGKTTSRIMPVYPLSAKVTRAMVMAGVDAALSAMERDGVKDPIPKDIREKYSLIGVSDAYRAIHKPQTMEDAAGARRRFAFEELLVLSIALEKRKERRLSGNAGIKMGSVDMAKFWDNIPYEPTEDQVSAIKTCISDMMKGEPMGRLIQGDVGCGKTLVAAALAYFTAKNGMQTAVMAPTEILANQHMETFSAIMGKLGIECVLLTGSMGARERREALDKIAAGKGSVVIGTHAIIQQGVEFGTLGLVIADEQHRFGVDQRARLSKKGENPHVLIMSATPIPRTLSMIIYGDLDISQIKTMPRFRRPVRTYCVGEDMRDRVYAFIRKLVSEGRQAYVVCPLVEEAGDGDERRAAQEYSDYLRDEALSGLRIGLVHGKMRAQDKDDVMKRFSEGKIDVLVATTVVEVGVNIPNAAIMVIENAERFGLSQLHQLRGRVGRSKHESHCVLFCSSDSKKARERLAIMCGTGDGFKIAEEDLRLRGPGDFFGSRQHGIPELRVASLLSDADIMLDARETAEKIMRDDPGLLKEENRALSEKAEELMVKAARL